MSELRDNYGKISNTTGWFILSGTVDGQQGSDNDAAVNGSITPVDFFISPPADTTYEIFAVSLEISDSGAPALSDYGSVAGPLANGTLVFAVMGGVEVPLSAPVKENRDLITLGPNSSRFEYTASVTVTTYEFNLLETATSGILIQGNKGDSIGFRIADDLSSLINHSITIKGISYVQA